MTQQLTGPVLAAGDIVGNTVRPAGYGAYIEEFNGLLDISNTTQSDSDMCISCQLMNSVVKCRKNW